MFDIGFPELVLIGIVGLLVIGPERLPDVAKTLGRWVGKAQRLVNNLKSDVHRELESGELRELLGEQRRQIEELQDMVSETNKEIILQTMEASSSAEQAWQEASQEIEQTVETAALSDEAELLDAADAAGDSADKDNDKKNRKTA